MTIATQRVKTPSDSSRSTGVKSRATLTMVAERAGVSPSTVSRILNGTAQVSEDKQALVKAVIEELGFRPDPAARSLAGGRTMSIGVLTQFIDSPYYGEALRGIEDELHKANYVPLFVSGHWNEVEEKNPEGDRKPPCHARGRGRPDGDSAFLRMIAQGRGLPAMPHSICSVVDGGLEELLGDRRRLPIGCKL